MSSGSLRGVPLIARPGAWVVGLTFALAAGHAQQSDPWEVQVLQSLCTKYVVTCPQTDLYQGEQDSWLRQTAASLGTKLAASGSFSVPARDIAALALLLARQEEASRVRGQDHATGNAPKSLASGSVASVSRDDARPAGKPQSEPGSGASAAGTPAASGSETEFADINKGEEGFAQGVDLLARLPVSERMVITGDITSGVQAATVTGASNLTSTFGRVRVNFVTRAVPASTDGRFSEGYFFVQMRAAGGPFDTSAVGGPASFSPLNDVATDRSRFNEGTSRGNIYLAKAFYQQELRVGRDHIVGRVGIINLSDFFDTNEFANNEARQFLSSAFVNSAGYKSGISAPGFMGEYHRKINRDWLQGVILRTGYAVSRTERAFTSPIWTGEAELLTTVRGRSGKYRFGGTLGNVADIGAVNGMHFGFDQWLSRNVGFYGRYAWSNSGPGSVSLGPVKQSYSGGVQWRFVDEADRVSAWAFGLSQAFGIATDDPLATERVLETYYRWQLSQNFSLTPDFQLVLGSGGNQIAGTHVVMGMRMNFGF